MAKFQFACVLLLLIAFVAIGCDAKKLKVRPVRLIQRHRHFSRQEAEPVTPYPTATELKPEIPFDEGIPADEPAPEEVFPEGDEHIPDEVYGPPDVAIATNIPDEVYGPPELDGNALPTEDFYAFQRVRKAYLIRRKAAALHQLKMTKLSKFSQLAKLIKAAKLAKLGKFGKLTLLKKKFA